MDRQKGHFLYSIPYFGNGFYKTKKKKDVIMRPRYAVDCNCAMGGKVLRSKTRTTSH